MIVEVFDKDTLANMGFEIIPTNQIYFGKKNNSTPLGWTNAIGKRFIVNRTMPVNSILGETFCSTWYDSGQPNLAGYKEHLTIIEE